MKKRLIRELLIEARKSKLKMSRKSESQMKKTRYGFFAGTTEGRLPPGMHHKMKMKCCVSTATEYGKSVLGENEGIRSYPAMDQSKMRAFIRKIISDSRWMQPIRLQDKLQKIFAPCEEEKIKYVRCLREEKRTIRLDHAGAVSDGRSISAASAEEAVNI